MNDLFVVSAFFVVLREVLEAALIAGVILAFLRRTGATQFRAYVWAGLCSGLAVSLLFAGMLTLLFSIRSGQPFAGKAGRVFEGTLFLVAAALLSWLVMWLTAGHEPVRKMESTLEGLLERDDRFAAKLALFAAIFLTVVREGFETFVLLVGAAEAGARFQWRGIILPAALALFVGLLAGWALLSGLMALDVARCLSATETLLLFLAAGLLAHGFHAFQVARMFGSRQRWWNHALWDSSACCDDTDNEFFASLRSLFGYNDAPTFVEILAYAAFWAAVATVMLKRHWSVLHRRRVVVARAVRATALLLLAFAITACVFSTLHRTWNGLFVSYSLLLVALACVVAVFDTFQPCMPAFNHARKTLAVALCVVVLMCAAGAALLHILQMACEERYASGRRCALGRFYYFGLILSENYIIRAPSFTAWNAVAVLTVSLLLSISLLVSFAMALLLFASNLDTKGYYMYRDIKLAKDITEEVGVGEVDITSDEAAGDASQQVYPWLYMPLLAVDSSSGAAYSSRSIVESGSLPDRPR